jgi:hypothetical protein
MANRLCDEKSPYLLQHAENPVDWHPWGPQAFERAAREDRPVFLSVGYSTCHWCHVMAHESFEDPEVAALMNEAFVNIKVDREERPEIDSIYMAVCQMLTGGGGWPLTIVMTPDKRPFFAATYIPRESRFGRAGMLELVPRIRELWRSRRGELVDTAARITEALGRRDRLQPGEAGEEPGPEALELAFRQLYRAFDLDHGGFGGAPRFPTPHNLLFLLRYHRRTGEAAALEMAQTTLDAMRRGGIFDQVGFGFHRYSTDERWLVPHFEKMLYDQALLALAYLEAHQATGAARHAETARQIFAYVLRDMTDAGGGFFSAEDADSEGVEGKFYLWTEEELREVLEPDDAELAGRLFNVDAGGNFREESTGERTGANILHLAPGRELPTAETLERIRRRLLARRERRARPGKDDKILADWNGLMIAALSRGAQALSEPRLAEAASRAADFVWDRMRVDGRLRHRYRAGEAAVDALLDDHAFMVWGLIELYQATFEPRHLERAIALNAAMLERLWDERDGAFFFAPDDPENLLVREKTVHDGAVPSGNAVAFWNLTRLARMTASAELEERAGRLCAAFAGRVSASPALHTAFLLGLDFALGPTHEVVVAGDPADPRTREALRALQSAYLPGQVLLLRPTGGDEAPAITCVAPFTADQTGIEGEPVSIYVCSDFHCHRPVASVDEALALMG